MSSRLARVCELSPIHEIPNPISFWAQCQWVSLARFAGEIDLKLSLIESLRAWQAQVVRLAGDVTLSESNGGSCRGTQQLSASVMLSVLVCEHLAQVCMLSPIRESFKQKGFGAQRVRCAKPNWKQFQTQEYMGLTQMVALRGRLPHLRVCLRAQPNLKYGQTYEIFGLSATVSAQREFLDALTQHFSTTISSILSMQEIPNIVHNTLQLPQAHTIIQI